jgi:hypothetical protein
MLYRVAPLALLVSVLLSLLPAPPLEAAPVVQMTARAGFDGAGKPGGWLPVVVDIRNDGDDVEGEIQILIQDTQTNRGTYTPAPTLYAAPAILPRRTRKQLRMEIRMPVTSQRIKARLVQGDDILLDQDVQFSRVAGGDVLCGLVSRTSSALEYIPSLELPPPLRRVRMAHLESADIPAQPQLMGSLDCLIVANYPTAGMTETQRDALRTWVSNGGLLVVAGGVGWQKTLAGLPADLLPIRATGTAALAAFDNLADFAREPLGGGGQYLASQAVVTDGTSVIEQDGVPLLVASRRGLGTVFYLGLDPAADPLRSWAGSASIWRYMLAHTATSVTLAPSGTTPFVGWGRTPRNAMVDITPLNPPSPVPLVALLALFAVVVGPGNALLLRKLGQPTWLMATAPLATGVAALLLFAVATANRDSDAVMTRVSIIRAMPGQPVGHAHTYAGLLAKQQGSYSVRGADGSLIYGQFFPFPRDPASEGPNWNLKVQSGSGASIDELAIQPGSLLTFTVDSQFRTQGGLETDVWTDGRSILGTITNRTGYTISDAVLMLDYLVYPSGGGRITLKPDETHEINGFELPVAASAGYGPPQNFAGNLYPSNQPKRVSDTARRDVLDSIFGTTFNLPKLDVQGLTLLGWMETPGVELEVSPARPASVDTTLYTAMLPVRLQKGYEGVVPAPLVIHRPLGATTATRQQWGSYDLAPGESVALQFSLPTSSGKFLMERLMLNVEARLRGPGSANARLGDVQFFNWRTADWDEQPIYPGSNVVQSSGNYVSGTGDVRMRYTFKPLPDAQVTGVTFSRLDVNAAGLMR